MTARRLPLALALALAACAGPPTVGTTAQELAVSPSIHDFGAIEVGQASLARQFVVSAALDELDYVDAITASCDGFVLDTSAVTFPHEVSRLCEVNPNAKAPPCPSITARFTGTFAPTFAGPQSCLVTITMQFAGDVVLTLSGTGTPPPVGQAVVAPGGDTLDFGDVVVATASSALPITVRSTGGNDLDLTGFTIDSADPGAFAWTEVGGDPLVPGDEHSWLITCTPSAAGPITGTATITSDAPTSPVTIALACNGIQSALAVAPSPVQFPETLIGESSQLTVTLQNTGSAALTFTTVQVTGAGFTADQPAATSLGAGESTTVTVTFTPGAADAGTDVLGTLVAVFDAGTREIDLIGPARDANLNVTPASAIDFGTVCAGGSREQLFVVVNGGSGAAGLAAVDVTGPGFAVGLIAPAALPAPLAAQGGSSATFRVTAQPPEGDVTGTLTLTPTFTGAPTVIDLRARGQAGGIGASPAALDFGGVVVGEPSGGRTIRLSNCDAAPLDVLAATVTGAAAAEFVAVAAEQTLPAVVPPGGSLLVVVELRPTLAGDKVAALELDHGATTTTVPLTGLAVGADEPIAGARGSYYACSAAGGGGGAAVAALAILLGLGRRRRRS